MILIRVIVRGYQLFISPMLQLLTGPGGGCRFQPTCSRYFLKACERHGVWHGTWLGLKRLARCGPWGGFGFDPVPSSRVIGARSSHH
jgi:uncharacterized protein